MTHSDEMLVRKIAAGDAAAFELLFCQYQEAISGHVLQIVRDSSTADDLVQEVFLRVWNRADQWRGQGTFKAWLFRIATNLAFNHLRSKKRRREQPLDLPIEPEDENEDLPAPSWMIDNAALGPDVQLEQTEQQRLLQGLIANLPDEKRDVFLMVHDAEMELREVAERLEIPEGTVKSRLHHARKRIAAEWQAVEQKWEDIE